MIEKVRTAVIGLGTIGAVHTDWYSQIPESKLTAVCDIVEDRAKTFAIKYNVDWHTDYHELLERKDIDAVTITAPNYLHAEIAIESAKAGKHVAVEKPLCTSLKQANQMIDVVRESGVLDLYCENLCFAPSYALAKEIVDKGGIGDPYMVRCREACDVDIETAKGSWEYNFEKAGGGCLMTTAIHCPGYIGYVLNNTPAVKVYAQTISKLVTADERLEDVGVIMVKYKGGQIGVVDSSYCATGGYDDRAEIYGPEGTILLDVYRRTPIQVHSKVGYSGPAHSIFQVCGEEEDRNWSNPIPDENWALGYCHELRHFMKCVQEGTRPKVNFDDGRASLEVVLAAYESLRSGNAVSLPLV